MSEIRFVYVIDDEPYVGTIDDFARSARGAYHSGEEMPDAVYVFNGGKLAGIKEIERSSTGFDSDDFATVTLTISHDGRTESASFTIGWPVCGWLATSTLTRQATEPIGRYH